MSALNIFLVYFQNDDGEDNSLFVAAPDPREAAVLYATEARSGNLSVTFEALSEAELLNVRQAPVKAEAAGTIGWESVPLHAFETRAILDEVDARRSIDGDSLAL